MPAPDPDDPHAPADASLEVGASATRPEELLELLAARLTREDRYEDQGEIARGGMGAIHRVHDTTLRRVLAQKVALAKSGLGDGSTPAAKDARLMARFLEEAQVTAQLDHPSIVPVHELGLNAEGKVYFTMPLVRGDDLGTVFKKVHAGEDGWTTTRVVGVLLKVCEAMSFAHEKRVVHRDLKPSNVMVGRHGEVYVMDWGLARVLDRPDLNQPRLMEAERSMVGTDLREAADESGASPLLTLDGDIVGTPAYMSPEQARGDLTRVGPASDVYSLGAMLYHLLAGHMPFAGGEERPNAAQVWVRLKEGPPERLSKAAPRAPAELVAICEKAMARGVAQRYPDVSALKADLSAYLEGRVVRAYETGALSEFRKWMQRNRAQALTAAAGVLAVIGTLAWAAYRQSSINDELTSTNDELTTAYGDLDEKTTVLREREARISELLGEAERATYSAHLASASIHLAEDNEAAMREDLEGCPPALRRWEWEHLSLRQGASLFHYENSGTGALDARFASLRGGPAVVSAGKDGSITVQGRDLGNLVSLSVPHPVGAGVLATTPDGHWFASGGGDGSLLIAEDLEARTRLELGPTSVGALAFSPSGDLLVAAEGYALKQSLGGVLVQDEPASCRLRFLDPRTGEVLRVVEEAHAGPILALAVSPDGQRVLSGGTDRVLREWDREGQLLAEHRGQANVVRCVAYGPSGLRFASGGEDHQVLVWDRASGESRSLRGHADDVLGLDFSPDGLRLASASADGSVRLWDAMSQQVINVLRGHRGGVHSVEFRRDGSQLLTAGDADGVRLWDANTSTPVSTITEGDLRLGRVEPGVVNRFGSWTVELGGVPHLLDAGLVRDPGSGITVGPGRSRRLRKEFPVEAWRDGRVLTTFSGHDGEGEVLAFAVAPGGRVAASGGKGGVARVWDVLTGAQLASHGGFEGPVSELRFDATGERLAIGSSDGRVCLLDVTSGEVSTCSQRHEGAVTGLAWSADGALVASGGRDARVHVFGADDGVLRHRLTGHAQQVTAVAFHPDGERLASAGGDNAVRLWDLVEGEPLLSLKDTDLAPDRLEFQLDGRRLVGANLRSTPTVTVWDSTVEDAREMWRRREVQRRARSWIELLAPDHEDPGALLEELARRVTDPEVREAAAAMLGEG